MFFKAVILQTFNVSVLQSYHTGFSQSTAGKETIGKVNQFDRL